MRPRARADAALVVVTLGWGITFPLLRIALRAMEPADFVAARFVLAAGAFLPVVVLRPSIRAGARRALVPGLALGALSWLCYQSQTIGLQTVAANRAAFLTGLNVILVPLIAPMFAAGRPSRLDLLAAVVALGGLLIMTRGAAGDVAHGSGLGAGELWILVCAILFAVYIHALQKVLRHPHEPVALAFTQIVGVMVCALAASLLTAHPLGWWKTARGWGEGAWISLLLCSLGSTVLAFWLQTRYQGQTTPQRAALIFALEPVFAAAWAWLLLRESLTGATLAGSAVILAAILLAEGVGAMRAPAGREPAEVEDAPTGSV